jgi:hypothetical protein
MADFDWMERLMASRPAPDLAKVQAQQHAYLVERGRALAQGLDLGQVNDQQAAELGRVDAIAQHPALPPGLAVRLEWVNSQFQHLHQASTDRWEARRAYCQAQGHHHTANATCDWFDQPAPDRLKRDSARGIDDPERTTGAGAGQDGHAAKGSPESPDRNGKKDPIREMIEFEPPDEEWSS